MLHLVTGFSRPDCIYCNYFRRRLHWSLVRQKLVMKWMRKHLTALMGHYERQVQNISRPIRFFHFDLYGKIWCTVYSFLSVLDVSSPSTIFCILCTTALWSFFGIVPHPLVSFSPSNSDSILRLIVFPLLFFSRTTIIIVPLVICRLGFLSGQLPHHNASCSTFLPYLSTFCLFHVHIFYYTHYFEWSRFRHCLFLPHSFACCDVTCVLGGL